MRRRGSGRGSFGDGADVNHFHRWFTRSQHALSASAPKTMYLPRTHQHSPVSHTHTHTQIYVSQELHSVGAKTAAQGRGESPLKDRLRAVSKSEGT